MKTSELETIISFLIDKIGSLQRECSSLKDIETQNKIVLNERFDKILELEKRIEIIDAERLCFRARMSELEEREAKKYERS